jgi:Arc/MetJ-type ribon-helix-helix transcriptional regulator
MESANREKRQGRADPPGLWQAIKDQLKAQGFDLDTLCCTPQGAAPLKVVCVPSSLRESVEEMGGAARDQVVMVRVDTETSKTLDAWVETGAVKSRSEAAALFIREGLKVRDQELKDLRDALADVEQAKSKLRDKARQVLGAEDDVEEPATGSPAPSEE